METGPSRLILNCVRLASDASRKASTFGVLWKENEAMTGIQFVTDAKGRRVAVQIDLKKYGAMLEDFWDGLISESRRKEKGIPFEEIKADLVKRGRLRG